MIFAKRYIEFLKNIEDITNIDAVLISLILAIHKLSAPETIMAIFREASNMFIEYLKQRNMLRLDSLENAIDDLCKNLTSDKLKISNNMTHKIEDGRLRLEVSNCMFKNICKHIDKAIKMRPEILKILETRPCGINILFSTLITSFDKIPETEKIECNNGDAIIIIRIT
ncbi:MAG: hypothetical protein GXO10_03875 [Crenarchaeota archaeon]|nr:hypothetical protein [Thermoproteota archaeon]